MRIRLISLLLLSLLYSQPQLYAQENFMIIGTYTGGKSEGIYVYRFNSDDGSYKEVSHIKASNPSFIAISPNEKFVYAVHENGKDHGGGQLSAYRFDKSTGSLTLVNTQSTQGDHPCYVEVDKTGKWVFAGNYSSGDLTVFPVNDDGSIGTATAHVRHSGSGPNESRQKTPHVHCVLMSPDNKWVYVPDLGTDKLMIYSFDASSGKLGTGQQAFAKSQPGAGPRHATFHPDGQYLYLLEELTGHVVLYEYDAGRLKLKQRTSSLPRGQQGYAGSADIHVSPDGKFLYASNRGDFNNIAMFKIDKKTRRVSIAGFQPAMGKSPRNFSLDPTGRYLLAGNQDSDEIVIFKRNEKTGLLGDTNQRISVGKPVCIKWITTKTN